jgi:isopentenyl-diphosphate delta-isomerase
MSAQTQIEVDAEQNRMMEEECILVDRNDRPIGHVSKRICHQVPNINAGMLHRAFSVFLFNSKGQLLLQQRAACKITFPLHWTNTCCSHPLHSSSLPNGGEEEETNALGVKRAAVRKLHHELGITGDVSIDSLHWLTKIHYGAASDAQWGEHEIDWILFCQTDLPVTTKSSQAVPYSCNECEDVRWVTQDELRHMISEWKEGKLLLTPWFALIAEQLLFGWWEQLSAVIQQDGIGEAERSVIHRLQEKPAEEQKQ